MKPMLKSARHGEAGFALMITLCFVTALLLLFGGVMYWASTNSALTQRNETFTKSEDAAEAATEKIFSQMNRDFLYGTLNTSNAYSALIPDTSTWPIQYTFSDGNGNANTTYVSIGQTNWESLNAQYAGLNGYANDCTIISVATPNNQLYNVPARVQQTFQAAEIPVFQFAIFYNMNMEMDPTPAMVINGPVFCNASIWATCVNSLTFNSTVEAAGTVTYNTSTDPLANGYSYGGVAPTFNVAGQPDYPVPPLILPIGNSTNSNPTNIESILNLPPPGLNAPNLAAYAPTNLIYTFNACDLIISNASYGTNGIASRTGLGTSVNIYATNFTIWYQDKFNATPQTPLTNNYIVLRTTAGNYTNASGVLALNITNYAATNIQYAGFSFLTNILFYDWREGWNGGSGISGKGKPVQAVQFDVAIFQKWLTNNSDGTGGTNNVIADNQMQQDYGHRIGSVYIYNNVPLTTTTLPAVRLVNGGMLPTNYPGLSVCTPMPVYILGNYNCSNSIGNDLGKNTTIHTRPASVLADAITILSPSWTDTTTSKLPAVNIDDTVNTALLEGIVPSNTNIVDSSSGGGYSGGVENVLRYLEDWSGNTNTYNGSIVVMFPSIYATNSFIGGGNYYNPPTRNWAFDNNFTNLADLPPIHPSAKSLIRNTWKAY